MTLFVYVNYVSGNHYFVQIAKLSYQANIVTTWQLRRYVILRNDKKYINFEIFDHFIDSTSQSRINAYTLILEKDFRILWKRKKVFVIQKLYDLIGKTRGFRIPLMIYLHIFKNRVKIYIKRYTYIWLTSFIYSLYILYIACMCKIIFTLYNTA